MNPGLAILDYSVYGNDRDPESDRLLAAAACACGMDVVVESIALGTPVQAAAERVWLRYDLRSRGELSWIAAVAHDLRQRGHRVFPPATSILAAEDKWETLHAFHAAGVSTLPTFLGFDLDRCGVPAMLKPRVGWGGQGNLVLRGGADVAAAATVRAEDYICQPYIPHRRTWVVAVAAGREIVAIEARREAERDGEVQVLPLPPGGPGLASAAVTAVGLVAGTVDLIETLDGLRVLEVNSAPRIPYPDLPTVDLATPMVRCVLAWMEQPCGS
jgi:glutathione synthase/RimK-type ligase-like ATP-grasp enzyme